MSTRARNLSSAIFCLLLGLAVAWKGLHLGLKLDREMGPGFFPLLAGGILASLSIILFVQSLPREPSPSREPFWAARRSWIKIFVTLFVLGLYPVVIGRLGFFLSSLGLVIFLFGGIARLRWWVAGFGGILTTIAFYVVFEIWLKANLPYGPLGF